MVVVDENNCGQTHVGVNKPKRQAMTEIEFSNQFYLIGPVIPMLAMGAAVVPLANG
jgi:hypothetical protein